MNERNELVIRRMVETLDAGMNARQAIVDQKRAAAKAIKSKKLNPKVVAYLRAKPSATIADVIRTCRVGKAAIYRARLAIHAEACS